MKSGLESPSVARTVAIASCTRSEPSAVRKLSPLFFNFWYLFFDYLSLSLSLVKVVQFEARWTENVPPFLPPFHGYPFFNLESYLQAKLLFNLQSPEGLWILNHSLHFIQTGCQVIGQSSPLAKEGLLNLRLALIQRSPLFVEVGIHAFKVVEQQIYPQLWC